MARPPFIHARHHIFNHQRPSIQLSPLVNSTFTVKDFFQHSNAGLWMLHPNCTDLSAAKRIQKTRDSFRHPRESYQWQHHRHRWTKLRHHHWQSQLTCFYRDKHAGDCPSYTDTDLSKYPRPRLVFNKEPQCSSSIHTHAYIRPHGTHSPYNTSLNINLRLWLFASFKTNLNKALVKLDPYPMPRIDHQFNKIGEGNKYFASLDLRSG